MIDICNPADPVEISSLDLVASPPMIEGDDAFLSGGPDSLQVLDLSNSAAPTELGFYGPLEHVYDLALRVYE